MLIRRGKCKEKIRGFLLLWFFFNLAKSDLQLSKEAEPCFKELWVWKENKQVKFSLAHAGPPKRLQHFR